MSTVNNNRKCSPTYRMIYTLSLSQSVIHIVYYRIPLQETEGTNYWKRVGLIQPFRSHWAVRATTHQPEGSRNIKERFVSSLVQTGWPQYYKVILFGQYSAHMRDNFHFLMRVSSFFFFFTTSFILAGDSELPFSVREIYLDIQVKQRLTDEWKQTYPLQEKHQAIIKATPGGFTAMVKNLVWSEFT